MILIQFKGARNYEQEDDADTPAPVSEHEKRKSDSDDTISKIAMMRLVVFICEFLLNIQK